MMKERKTWLAGLVVGVVMLMATPAFARGISMKDGGIALWIFIIIGAVIVLLQLIPAGILFFSFIGTASSIAFKGKKQTGDATGEEKGKLAASGYEPAPVKK
jgi:hypothetical protein